MFRARILLPLLLTSIVAGRLSAQALIFNGNTVIAEAGQDRFSGSGTATITPGGSANVSLSVIASGDDGCSDTVQVDLAATLTGGDKLNLRIFLQGIGDPPAVATLNGTFVVTGGTGQYAGKGGSGSATLTLTRATSQLTVALTGALSTPFSVPASLRPSGVVPVYSSKPRIYPGSWVSVYGDNLANATTLWNGDFPTSLGGVTATVNGKPAYLWFVSPNQINLQFPDDPKRGCVDFRLNTPNGLVSIQVELSGVGPSLSLLDSKYAAAIIPNASGAYGTGANAYDIAGAPGRYAFNTRKVKKGENLVLYGVGFGPVSTPIPAGKPFSGGVSIAPGIPYNVDFGGVQVVPQFIGMVGAGLYQVNLRVPANVPSGDIPVRLLIGGSATQDNVLITVE